MSDTEETIAYCWHCDRGPRAEGQILCNDCIEEAAGEIAGLALDHVRDIDRLTAERDEAVGQRDTAIENGMTILFERDEAVRKLAHLQEAVGEELLTFDLLTNWRATAATEEEWRQDYLEAKRVFKDNLVEAVRSRDETVRERDELRAKAALADEMASLVSYVVHFGQTIYRADFQRDWLARYDALSAPAPSTEGKE